MAPYQTSLPNSLHGSPSWLPSIAPLHDFPSWLPFIAPLHDSPSWLPFMTPYHIAFMFPVMTSYQKGNAKR